MGRRVQRSAHCIGGLRNHLVAAGDDSANRHIAGRRSFGGKFERAAHGWGQREAHRLALAKAPDEVSYMLLLAVASASLPGLIT